MTLKLSMDNLWNLFELSVNSNLLTFEATVDTGFEVLAAVECQNKLGPDTAVCCERGRIYVNVPICDYNLVKNLRSINNVRLVSGVLKNVNLLPIEENNMEHDLEEIGKLADQISWKKYLDSWKAICNFEGNLYPTREEYLKATLNKNGEEINENIVRYRITCYRSGKHSFGSQDAARSFGGRLQDMFQWVVNLSTYQLEIILDIKATNVVILIALTESSLHRRNISHFGLTTLRSSISYNLLQVAEPQVGEIIVDPFCGSGSIPMEGAIGFPGTFHVCGDINENSVKLTSLNKSSYAENFQLNLSIDLLRWDVMALPLKNACIDIVTTDLPFGRRVGSKFQNQILYPNALKELARVVKPSTGRVVLLTSDRRSYSISLQRTKKYWKQMKMLAIKLGGLKAFVYLLRRTDITIT